MIGTSAPHLVFCGYHGTTQTNGHNILSENKYNLSTGLRHWLGDGIYFFEKLESAVNWVERYPDSIVLESDIEVREDKLFNLLDSEHMDVFEETAEKILNDVEKYSFPLPKISRLKIDGFVINFIADNLYPFDVVVAAFYFESSRLRSWKYNSWYGSPTRIKVPEIQYCVRREDCITGTRLKVV